jgi:hypothetical protein
VKSGDVVKVRARGVTFFDREAGRHFTTTEYSIARRSDGTLEARAVSPFTGREVVAVIPGEPPFEREVEWLDFGDLLRSAGVEPVRAYVDRQRRIAIEVRSAQPLPFRYIVFSVDRERGYYTYAPAAEFDAVRELPLGDVLKFASIWLLGDNVDRRPCFDEVEECIRKSIRETALYIPVPWEPQ